MIIYEIIGWGGIFIEFYKGFSGTTRLLHGRKILCNIWKKLLAVATFLFLSYSPVYGLDATLTRDANSGPDLKGYKIFYNSGTPEENLTALPEQRRAPLRSTQAT